MSGQFEARLYSLRKSRDGVIVGFLVQPHDVSRELVNLDVGAIVMIQWQETESGQFEDGQGETSRAASDDSVKHSAASPSAEPPREKPKRAFKELSLPEQAGIRCLDEAFQEFIRLRYQSTSASDFVRSYCDVVSRAELSTNHTASNRWRKLEAEYQTYLADLRYSETVR